MVAGPFALANVTYFVSGTELAVEESLIGLPNLHHLGVDTKSLLEQKRDVLDGADCSDISPRPRGCHVGHLMIARLC